MRGARAAFSSGHSSGIRFDAYIFMTPNGADMCVLGRFERNSGGGGGGAVAGYDGAAGVSGRDGRGMVIPDQKEIIQSRAASSRLHLRGSDVLGVPLWLFGNC